MLANHIPYICQPFETNFTQYCSEKLTLVLIGHWLKVVSLCFIFSSDSNGEKIVENEKHTVFNMT